MNKSELNVGDIDQRKIEVITDTGAENLYYLPVEFNAPEDLTFKHKEQNLKVISFAMQKFGDEEGNVGTHSEEEGIVELYFPLTGKFTVLLETGINSNEFNKTTLSGTLSDEQMFNSELKLVETEEGVKLEVTTSDNENPENIEPMTLPSGLKHGSEKFENSDGWIFAVKLESVD